MGDSGVDGTVRPRRHPRAGIGVGVLALMAAAGCSLRENPDAAFARSRAARLEGQVRGLERTIERAERGDLKAGGQIAIGISEGLATRLLDASLPVETLVAGRLRVRVESARPRFRGTEASFAFGATVASTDIESASASFEITGTLERFELDHGHLRAHVAFDRLEVPESGAGGLAAVTLEAVLQANASVIESAIPLMELPVEVEEAFSVGGLQEGPVSARPGRLPLDMRVGMVVVSDGRLWVLLDARAGRWQPLPGPSPGPGPGA